MRAKRPEHDPSFGNNYCFVAIERNTKLVLNFTLCKRDQATTNVFIRRATPGDGAESVSIDCRCLWHLPLAIEHTVSDHVDFAQLIKIYRATPEGERRYSPAEVVSTARV